MSTTITCRACRGLVAIEASQSGLVCSCPHCGADFTAPGKIAIQPASYPITSDFGIQEPRPLNIQVNVPPRPAKHRDNGAVWFLKWMLAPALVLIGLWIGFRVLATLNSTLDTDGERAKQRASQSLRNEIIEQVAAAVKTRGVTEPSRDMRIEDMGNGRFIVHGRGMAVNDLVSFRVELIRTEFSDRTNYHAKQIDVARE